MPDSNGFVPRPERFVVGELAVDPAANELVAPDGSKRRIEARAMDVLAYLHARRGAVVSGDELLDAVWGGAAVSAHSVAIVISDLRKALGDDARAPRFIETVPKRGYRLIEAAGVTVSSTPPAPGTGESGGAIPGARRRAGLRWALAAGGLGAIVAGAVLFGGAIRREAALSPELALRYEQARTLWSRREPEGAQAARRLLDELLAERDDFAPAHAAMADLYVHKTGEYLGVSPLEAYRAAQRHLDRALALDPELPDAHVTRALLAFYRDRQSDTALAALDRALTLDPTLARGWQSKGMVLSAVGRHEESLAAIARARELDPVSPSAAWDEVWFLYLAGRFDEAAEAAERAASYSPRNRFYAALIAEGRGQHAEAIEAWLARAAERGVALAAPDAVRALAAAGDRAGAYRELLRQREAVAGGAEWETVRAAWQLLGGEPDEAARTLVATAAERENWSCLWLAEMPLFAPLAARDDVRSWLARANGEPRSAG